VEDNARVEVMFTFNTMSRVEVVPQVQARCGGIEVEGVYKNAIEKSALAELGHLFSPLIPAGVL